MANLDQGLLRRAFSVYLFDTNNRLLLQQRASEKITLACCSHPRGIPLGIPGETGMAMQESIMGVKRAAQRKRHHELGVHAEQVLLALFKFLTNPKAPSDGKWVAYILFVEPASDVKPNINPNEFQATRYVSEDGLNPMLNDDTLKFIPWFKLIWWEHLGSGLDKYLQESDFRRMV